MGLFQVTVKGTIVPKHVALTMSKQDLSLIVDCMASWNEGPALTEEPLNEQEKEILDALLKILNA